MCEEAKNADYIDPCKVFSVSKVNWVEDQFYQAY